MEHEDEPSTDLETRDNGVSIETLAKAKAGVASSGLSRADEIPVLMGSLNDRLDLYAKRLAIGSVSIVFGAVIFPFSRRWQDGRPSRFTSSYYYVARKAHC